MGLFICGLLRKVNYIKGIFLTQGVVINTGVCPAADDDPFRVSPKVRTLINRRVRTLESL